MKKRILINIHYLEIGGAETSLIGLLHSLNPEHFEVDLLINYPHGEMMAYIPSWVNIISAPVSYSMIERPLMEVIRRGYFKVAVGRLQAKRQFRKYCKVKKPSDGNAIFGYVAHYVTPKLPSLNYLGEYDSAISYVTPHNIVRDKVKAKKKIAWIHTDYSKIDTDAELELPVWSSFDKIVSISPSVTESFLSVFPSLGDKIIEVENFLPLDLIKKRADELIPEDMPDEIGVTKLLTIGRYCEAKRIDEIPVIAKHLQSERLNFKWYIIGYGNPVELEKIKKGIKTYNVEDRVVILGKKENPYPYIKTCDIYVQPSRYEGKSITVREAQVLDKPVVITNYPTAKSQVEDSVDGFIGPYETLPFASYLSHLLQNKSSLNKILTSTVKTLKARINS